MVDSYPGLIVNRFRHAAAEEKPINHVCIVYAWYKWHTCCCTCCSHHCCCCWLARGTNHLNVRVKRCVKQKRWTRKRYSRCFYTKLAQDFASFVISTRFQWCVWTPCAPYLVSPFMVLYTSNVLLYYWSCQARTWLTLSTFQDGVISKEIHTHVRQSIDGCKFFREPWPDLITWESPFGLMIFHCNRKWGTRVMMDFMHMNDDAIYAFLTR